MTTHRGKMTQAERAAAERRRVAAVIAANKRRALNPVWRANAAAAMRRSAADPDSKWSRAHRRACKSKKFRETCRRSALIAHARRRAAAGRKGRIPWRGHPWCGRRRKPSLTERTLRPTAIGAPS
jgi:hypothetical protein